MDIYYYGKLYSLLWFVLDLCAVMTAILGCVMTVHGSGPVSRFIGLTLMMSCLAILAVGVGLAFEPPFQTLERFSDEYIKHVKEPEVPRIITLWENIIAAIFAVVSLLGNLALLGGTTHALLKRRRKSALASA